MSLIYNGTINNLQYVYESKSYNINFNVEGDEKLSVDDYIKIKDTSSSTLDNKFHNIYVINTIIGVLSAIVDNVPLVAGAMGMYSVETYPVDHTFWELLAYCAGTGGSILIIGSAAGVAIMGTLKINFIWYLRKISLLALAGYLAGVLTYIILN